jgi:serine/threonine protein kinase
MEELKSGEVLRGRKFEYKIVRNLGEGGAQGTVYVAEVKSTARRCAVKVFSRAQRREDSVRLEYLVRINLPRHDRHLAGPIDILELPPASVSPLVEEAVSLADFTSEEHDITQELRILEQIIALNAKIEQIGIEHGDISYENILVGQNSGQEVSLIDFDGYNAADSRIPPSNISGTPPLIDPAREYAKDFGIKGDVFPLSVLVVDMLTERTPFPTDSLEHYFNSLSELHDPPNLHSDFPELTPNQCNLLSRGLSPRRSDRPQMADLAAEFSHISSQVHVCIHCNKAFYLDRSRCVCPLCGKPNRLALRLNGGTFDLRSSQITVGRSGSNDIAVKYYPGGDTVSSQHALITRWGTKYSIKDLGSTNGTQVNGSRMTPNVPHSLGPGDVITLGDLQIKVVVWDK